MPSAGPPAGALSAARQRRAVLRLQLPGHRLRRRAIVRCKTLVLSKIGECIKQPASWLRR